MSAALELYALVLSPALCYLIPAQVSFSDAWASFTLIGIIPCAFFYFMSFLYFLLDVFSSRSWIIARKFQGASGVVAWKTYVHAFITSVKSWFVGLSFTWLVSSRLGPLRGCPPVAADWSAREFALHIIPFILIVDVVFYVTHRLLHTRMLYALVHKVHHSFSAPFALAAVYAHPLEHLMSNVLSISAGPLVLGSHPITCGLWACVAIFSTTGAHSGFSFSHIKPAHDWHHESFTGNFGAGFGVLDALLGTSCSKPLKGGRAMK